MINLDFEKLQKSTKDRVERNPGPCSTKTKETPFFLVFHLHPFTFSTPHPCDAVANSPIREALT